MARSQCGDAKAHVSSFLEEMRAIIRLYEQYIKSVGIPHTALSILDIIYTSPGGCTQKLIGETAGLSKQTVNAIVRGFLDQGFIELREMDGDRRNKEIRLSESGRDYARAVLGRLYAVEEYAMGKLTGEQRAHLISVLKTIGTRFRESLDQPPPVRQKQ